MFSGSSHCPTSESVVHQRWRSLTGSRFDVTLISICIHDSNEIISLWLYHVFWVVQHDQTTAETARCVDERGIEDGGHQSEVDMT